MTQTKTAGELFARRFIVLYFDPTMNDKSIRKALRLIPQYRHYVWGGSRLLPGVSPTAEAWVVYAQDLVATPPFEGRTLADVALEYGPALLGRRAVEKTGSRFPLLIKLLDVASWLSLQVHPDDAHAQALEGPGFFGKMEAWHFLEAEPGAEILCGVKPRTTLEQLDHAFHDGTILEHMLRLPVRAGESILIRPGMIHALGPGLLVYEVQQTSDLTYRVFDWNRPATPERPLHLEKSLAVVDPAAEARLAPDPALGDGGRQVVVDCPYFTLAVLAGETQPLSLDTGGESFAALTVIEGEAQVEGDGWSEHLKRYETLLAPADCGAYRVSPVGNYRALHASVSMSS
jgi:mannose-6-phosphate isomerase